MGVAQKRLFTGAAAVCRGFLCGGWSGCYGDGGLVARQLSSTLVHANGLGTKRGEVGAGKALRPLESVVRPVEIKFF